MMTRYVVQEWWLETRIKTHVDLLSIQMFFISAINCCIQVL